MAKYSFKSSGFLKRAENEIAATKSLPPISIKTPLMKSDDGKSSLFNMHYKVEDMIHDNFKNMLMTNPGERLGRPDFGAGLTPLTMEYINSESYEETVMMAIKRTSDLYMPFIELETFNSENFLVNSTEQLQQAMTRVRIIVEYSVPKLSIIKKPIEINLYVAG